MPRIKIKNKICWKNDQLLKKLLLNSKKNRGWGCYFGNIWKKNLDFNHWILWWFRPWNIRLNIKSQYYFSWFVI